MKNVESKPQRKLSIERYVWPEVFVENILKQMLFE